MGKTTPTRPGMPTSLPQPLSDTEHREAIRDMLTRRYRGAIPVTDEMIDAVMSGLGPSGSPGEPNKRKVTP